MFITGSGIWRGLLAGCVTVGLLWLMLRSERARSWAPDHANARSLHTGVIPRFGGVGIWAGVVCALLGASLERWEWGVLLLAGLLAGMSWLDDRRGMGVGVRLMGHITAVAVGLWILSPEMQMTLLLLVGVLWVWTVNLFNFMDGADGLVGSVTAIGLLVLACAASSPAFLPLIVIMGALAGFLFHNWHPARTFMGDAGSVPLGFLMFAFSAGGAVRGDWSIWYPALVFAPLWVDASATLLRRAVRGERVWQAHREHYYQRLARMGCSHRSIAMAYLSLSALAGFSAWSVRQQAFSAVSVLVTVWVAVFLILGVVIDGYWRRRIAQEP